MINKYKRKNPIMLLTTDRYWDMVLSQDRPYRMTFGDGNCGLVIDATISGCPDTVRSTVSWDGCTSEGVTLEDIGLTGIDNGLIKYEKDKISNQEFYDIITGSRYQIDDGDCFMKFHRVTGNTGLFSYGSECTDEDGHPLPYARLKGGFYQGFYALDGFGYRILPSAITDSWNVMLNVRPRDYEESGNTLNMTHPDNDGFIFYIGTRAENKFAQFYKGGIDKFEDRDYVAPGCNVVESDYFLVDESQRYKEDSCDEIWMPDFYEVICLDGGECGCNKPEPCGCRGNRNNGSNAVDWGHFLNTYGYSEYSMCRTGCDPCAQKPSTPCGCKKKGGCNDGMKLTGMVTHTPVGTGKCGCGGNGGSCNYGEKLEPVEYKTNTDLTECGCGCKPKKKKENKCGCGGSYFIDSYKVRPEDDNGSYVANGDGYFKDVTLSGLVLTTADGRPLDDQGYYEIQTDNKFLTFNRTKTGFITSTYDPDDIVVLTGTTKYESGNKFLTYNRTKTGLKAFGCKKGDWETEQGEYEKEYDVLSDIMNNAFGVRIRKDGSIGYRYLVKNCDAPDGYSILEEYSFPNTVKPDVWSRIRIEIIALREPSGTLNHRIDNSTYKIRIHVNGKLRFVSKEIPAFRIRALKEMSEKQEGVPFNISVGGGTQGLCDSVWLDYYKPFMKILPLEKYFAGTFIGDVSMFKLYIGDCTENL